MKPTLKMPWDFVGPPAPGAPAVPSRSSIEGRMLGRQLARFVDIDEERRREAGVRPLPERCHDCAFRRGTVPNGCLPTVMTALKCAVERETFLCHLGDQKSVCRGWAAMVAEPVPAQPREPILLPAIGEELPR